MKHRPMFSCLHQGCAEEVSYHADMLKEHPDGGLVCQSCWEYEDGPEKDWHDLPDFIPNEDKRIANLKAAMKDACVHITDYIDDDDPPLIDLELARDVLRRRLREDG